MATPNIGAAEPGLDAYVDAVASAAPTPGGGSVAAVVGALAAALGEMVVNLSVGRTAAAAVEDDLGRALATLRAARRSLLDLAVADERAYGGFLAATALPKGSPEEKSARTAAMQTALHRAAEAPASVGDNCLSLFPILEEIARIGNRHLLSDAVIAAILAEAAARAAAVNVRVNAGLIRDEAVAAGLIAKAAATESDARVGMSLVADAARKRGG